MEQSPVRQSDGVKGACEVSVVVPTYKEAQNVRPLVAELAAALGASGRTYEIIFVDDDSRDGIDKQIGQLAAQGQPVRLITRTGQRGLSTAVICGFNEAGGAVLVCMDADLSHPPSAIPDMLKELDAPEVDFVIGSRYVRGGRTEEGWGVLRWLNSKVATLLARPFTSVKDPMAGFFALRKDTYARAATLGPVGYKIGLELLVKCRCRNVREVPILFSRRRAGASKLSLREQLNYLKHLKRLADFKFGVLSQLLQFCAVGATGVAVDLSAYALLLRIPAFRIAIARALAIWVAMTWNFFLNRRLTFSYSRLGSKLVQYPRFVATCTLGAVLSWSVAVGLARLAPFFARHLMLGAIVGIIVGTACNFLISRHYVFRRQAARQ
jgi:dolichol-phosphate mannosyltransferase